MPDRSTRPPGPIRDLIALAKPGITAMCVLMTGGAMWLAPGPGSWQVVVATLIGTTLAVASANALNMVWERRTDRLMARTKDRPIAAGRMSPTTGAFIGLVEGIAGVALLWNAVNPLTGWLGLIAILSYVLMYTPLKRLSTVALFVGAVPGAIPPLLGWTAATGQITAPGVVLFLILLLWQLPHFLAISIYRRRDYERAGILVVPSVKGEESARNQAFAYSLLLVPISLLLVPMGVAGFFYFSVASLVGAWFFILSVRGFEPESGNRWARQFFFASLIYLPALTLALAVDVVV